jgi:hypothetical protein
MVPLIATLTAVQALGSGVHAAINAYLSSPPRASFTETSGRETPFDEDNWARILDTHAVLFLVRPFISGIQNMNLDNLPPSKPPQRSSGGRTLGSDHDTAPNAEDPPTYQETHIIDPHVWLSNAAYGILRTSQKLVETLTTASAGPSGSTPLAWNLHVSASVETSIELLTLYRVVTSTMSAASTGSVLGQAYLMLNLQDTDLLADAERTYRSIGVGVLGSSGQISAVNACQLRQPSSRLCLGLPIVKHPVTTAWDRTREGALWTGTLLAGGALGAAALGIYKSMSSANMAKVNAKAASPQLVRQGSGQETLIFERLEDDLASTKGGTNTVAGLPHTEHKEDVLCHGLLVKVGFTSHKTESLSNWLTGSTSSEAAALRIVHWDDRYRVRETKRSIVPGDRIVLREEETGKLLARKQITDEQWEVGFGISDDVLWRVSLAI